MSPITAVGGTLLEVPTLKTRSPMAMNNAPKKRQQLLNSSTRVIMVKMSCEAASLRLEQGIPHFLLFRVVGMWYDGVVLQCVGTIELNVQDATTP